MKAGSRRGNRPGGGRRACGRLQRWRGRVGRTWRSLDHRQRLTALAASAMALILVVALSVTAVDRLSYSHHIKQVREDQEQSSDLFSFDPGMIITDARFHDTTGMNTEDIQSFLEEKGAACQGDRCLKNLKVDTATKEGDDLCGRFQGGKGQTAASVIDGAARACGVSQKVLLTILQKEQHLVTAKDPSDFQLKAAMGLSCPDDASCDPKYAGFFNQVYGSARRFRYYQTHRDRYHFRTGAINQVAFSPDRACGGGDVFIENDATALLYIYTPYQPNRAALEAGSGEGNSCSAYGNRNFSLIYRGWFGDPAE
ncbi:hemagglutinin [Bifidobacterium favimelis]|uniref:Hemagglutinin n=1 Tax=Bifidobacterium favimelis TaxID=3122979 RepID=A0ABU8ZNW6_9BIFI